jgi:hypothetical protein
VTFRRLITVLALGALFAVPAGAYAQSQPLVDVYGAEGERVENQISPPGEVEAEVVAQETPAVPEAPTAASQPQPEEGGELPFTGLDARLLLIAGIVLAGIGFATRRLASRVE